MISRQALCGYVLEELLAAELKRSGFSLLVEPDQDPLALLAKANGLCVRGRGADHQVDVLGQLSWKIPFSLPLRLFVEAKFRADAVGIGEVRNALGVVNDVNEHYSTAVVRDAQPDHYKRYDYRYSLFSASGFTPDAEQFAFAQRISLIDLSGSSYEDLLRVAVSASRELLKLAKAHDRKSFPVLEMRESLRRALGTWSAGESTLHYLDPETENFATATNRVYADTVRVRSGFSEQLARIAVGLTESLSNTYYLGTITAPFLVMLSRDDARSSPRRGPIFASTVPSSDSGNRGRLVKQARVVPHVSGKGGEEWELETDDEVFRFSAPAPVEQEILESSRHERTEEPLRSAIFVPDLLDDEMVISFQKIDREETRRSYREADKRSSFGGVGPISRARWTREAAQRLVEELDAEGLVQGQVIMRAVSAGGAISREEVYSLAGYPETRTLRGFTRPTRRITAKLVKEGELDSSVTTPLEAVYAAGVLATHFRVPRELVEIFAE